MRRAGVRVPSGEGQERATAGIRPLPGGRGLMGFKDLWLTGPLSGPRGPAAPSFRDAGEACGPGIPEMGSVSVSGFRARASGAPRNDKRLGHREHNQLIGHLARTGLERARSDVEVLADHRRARAMAALRHGRQRPPVHRFRIEGLVVGECVGRKLAAQHYDHALVERIGKSAARGRQRRPRRPRVGLRIVDVVGADPARRAGDAAADGMELAVERDQRHVVARLRQRRALAPARSPDRTPHACRR